MPMVAISSQKRKAESMSTDPEHSDISPPTTKKVSSSKIGKNTRSPTSKTRTYTAAELADFSHDELVAYAVSLQEQLDAKPSAPTVKELTPEELTKREKHLRTLMERQIRKSMTWKPSCKTGSATFSQDFLVQSEQVLRTLFRHVVKEGSKAWKMKKFSVDDFEEVVGQDIRASVRYSHLVLTSDVTIRWDPANGTMKCSGKYGIPGSGRAALTTVNDDDNSDG